MPEHFCINWINMSLRKKPWNRTNQPVYAVSTRMGDESNMHIVSYVTPISMNPKQYIVGLYHGTKSLSLAEESPCFVLQLLHEEQYPLIRLLGQQSGHTINKIQRLQKRKLLSVWHDFFILKDALAVLLLNGRSTFEGGDHRGFLCDVTDYKNLNEGAPLTLDYLRAKKIIRG